MIVAHNHQHATLRRRSGGVTVLENVQAAIRTGPLPYHRANTPSTSASANRLTCCVPQTAVAASSSLMPGWKWILCSVSCFLAFQRLVEVAERRPSVSGNEAGGIQPRRRVAHLLQRRQMNQGLDADMYFNAAGCVPGSIPRRSPWVHRQRGCCVQWSE